MIYYCIKPIEVTCYKVTYTTVSSGVTYLNTNTIWEAYKHLINEGDEVDILLEESLDGSYSITINNKISSIHKLDIDHFVTQAEWRERQIKSVIDA